MELNASAYSAMIKRGVVLLSSFEDIDHKKFFVVIGEGENDVVGFFFINSNINRYIGKIEKFRNMQMHIKHSTYPYFLTHDSFIGGHKLMKIPKSTLARQIQSGEAQYRGELTPEDLERLLDNLRSSSIYPATYKKTFFKPSE
jgi:hypothetical protein